MQKKSILRWLIPVIVLVLLAAAFLYFRSAYVMVGGKPYKKTLTELDLRQETISVKDYEKLSEALPNATIYWNIPLGGQYYDMDAESITVISLTEEEISNFAYFTDLKELDITACYVTAEQVQAIEALQPNVEIQWTVAVGSDRIPQDAEDIRLTSLSAQDVSAFAYLPNLKTVDATACADLETILALQQAYPEVVFTWNVTLGGASYASDTTELEVDSDSVTGEELLEQLQYLPSLTHVSVTGEGLTEEQQDAIVEKYPDISFSWQMHLFGETYAPGTTELSFADKEFTEDEIQELTKKIARFGDLETLDLTGSNLTQEQLFAIADANENAAVLWNFELYGDVYSTGVEEMDLSDKEIADIGELEAYMPYLRRLTKVDMSDALVEGQTDYSEYQARSYTTDEFMDTLNKKYPDVDFVWTLHITVYDIRTDAVYFRSSFSRYGYFAEEPYPVDEGTYWESVMRLQYCHDMVCLDIGHRRIDTLEFLYGMPHLKWLCMLDTRAHDLTPIASLQELTWLEMNRGEVDNITPLKECKALTDLNITFLYAADTSFNLSENIRDTILEMPQLDRFWYSHDQYQGGVQLSDEDAAIIQEKYPDLVMYNAPDWDYASGDPWRYDEDYYAMRDIMGVFYMNESGKVSYKMVDGERVELDPEFLAQQKTWDQP